MMLVHLTALQWYHRVNMGNPETIGIVGCAGDLGSAIAYQAMSRGFSVVGYDLEQDNARSVTRADMLCSHVGELIVPRVQSIASLLAQADIVHWCAPIETVDAMPIDLEDGLLLLHDSVMANSYAAKQVLAQKTYRSVSIVHFLMNNYQKVVVAEESDSVAGATIHVTDLGLSPVNMTVKEHDLNMAHSQAPFALLHEMLASELVKLAGAGLLTPSGEAMSSALQDRSAIWTDATFTTLLSNPELPDLLDRMKQMLEMKNGTV
jgi:prephenate dehydrogenase